MANSNSVPASPRTFIKSVHGIRYQVKDVVRSVAFYTKHFGFKIKHQHLPQFAALGLGEMVLLLSGPGSSGSRQLPGGQTQEPGGCTRLVLHTLELAACITTLKESGLRFRNELESGPAGSQVQVEDPDGNPIELFEPAIE